MSVDAGLPLRLRVWERHGTPLMLDSVASVESKIQRQHFSSIKYIGKSLRHSYAHRVKGNVLTIPHSPFKIKLPLFPVRLETSSSSESSNGIFGEYIAYVET